MKIHSHFAQALDVSGPRASLLTMPQEILDQIFDDEDFYPELFWIGSTGHFYYIDDREALFNLRSIINTRRVLSQAVTYNLCRKAKFIFSSAEDGCGLEKFCTRIGAENVRAIRKVFIRIEHGRTPQPVLREYLRCQAQGLAPQELTFWDDRYEVPGVDYLPGGEVAELLLKLRGPKELDYNADGNILYDPEGKVGEYEVYRAVEEAKRAMGLRSRSVTPSWLFKKS